jgi:hypothetical protein
MVLLPAAESAACSRNPDYPVGAGQELSEVSRPRMISTWRSSLKLKTRGCSLPSRVPTSNIWYPKVHLRGRKRWHNLTTTSKVFLSCRAWTPGSQKGFAGRLHVNLEQYNPPREEFLVEIVEEMYGLQNDGHYRTHLKSSLLLVG